MVEEKPNTNDTTIALCRHCFNTATQRLVYKNDFIGELNAFDGETFYEKGIYYVSKCDTCNELSVYVHLDYFDPIDRWADALLVYPVQRDLSKNVPDKICKTYEEAVKIAKVSPSAFAVLIRRALEYLCDDKKASGKTLNEKIHDLAEKQIIPPVLAEVTDHLRILGNIGAHASEVEVNKSDVYLMKEFFDAVIEYVYIAPEKVIRLKDQIARKLGHKSNKTN